jgi:hypothetical protein
MDPHCISIAGAVMMPIGGKLSGINDNSDFIS